MTTTLLIDADIVAYKVAAINQETHDFGDTGSGRFVDHNRALSDLEEILAGYCQKLKTNNMVICLTDPDRNFRKDVYPLYKSKRTTVEKPELLQWAKDYMYREYRSFVRPRLEADDVMGILATSETIIPGKKIIVSEDKDMCTIPGYVYNPGHPDRGVRLISKELADRAVLYQTIIGDPTDGYPGCPGAGPASQWAQAVLQAPIEECWDIVLQAYDYHDLTEEDALIQARCAHILRRSSYDFKAKLVKLWTPACLRTG